MAGRDGRTLKLQIVGDIGDIKKDVASVNKTIGGLGKAAKGIGVAVAGAFAMDTVVDFAKGAIDAASDLAESQGKVGVVFGKSADAIERWSDDSVRAMGLSKQKALEAAGTFGNLFDALGLAEDATVDMSEGVVQLASDLASFNNVGVEETLQALQSGLLGEAEPLRKFGASLSEARVQAYGMANGIGEAVTSGKSVKWVMSDAQKVTARYGLILEDTANAQGDFARTSDGLANQQRILDANFANLSATLGSALVGPMADLTSWLNGLVGTSIKDGALSRAADEWLRLNEAIEETPSPEEAGQWLGTGTPFDSVLDGLNNVHEGLMDALIPQKSWVDAMEEAGKTAGATTEDLNRLAYEVREAGGTYEDFAAIVERAAVDKRIAENAEAVKAFQEQYGWGWWIKAGDAVTSLGVAGAAAATDWEQAAKDLKGSRVAFEDLFDPGLVEAGFETTTKKVKGKMRSFTKIAIADPLKEAKREARLGMAEIQWALEHPLTESELEKEYRRVIRKGTAAMNKALKEGNGTAYAEASDFVRRYKAKLAELRRQSFRVNVRMVVDESGLTGNGATLFAGLLGGVGGTKGHGYRKPKNHAAGLDYVPYDGYPALLHRGEAVLPERENRAAGATNNYHITVQAGVGDPVEIGRAAVRAIREYEKRSGAVWRTA